MVGDITFQFSTAPPLWNSFRRPYQLPQEQLLRCKMLHQKYESYRYVLPLKNWVNCISTGRKKKKNCHNLTFWEKGLKIKNHFYTSWIPSTILLLILKPTELKELLSPFRKLELPVMFVCLVCLLPDKKRYTAKKNNSECANLQQRTKIIQIEPSIRPTT